MKVGFLIHRVLSILSMLYGHVPLCAVVHRYKFSGESVAYVCANNGKGKSWPIACQTGTQRRQRYSSAHTHLWH